MLPRPLRVGFIICGSRFFNRSAEVATSHLLPAGGALSLYSSPVMDSIPFLIPSEQRLAFLSAQEESSTSESAAAPSPQQAEPQAAPLRQLPPG